MKAFKLLVSVLAYAVLAAVLAVICWTMLIELALMRGI